MNKILKLYISTITCFFDDIYKLNYDDLFYDKLYESYLTIEKLIDK